MGEEPFNYLLVVNRKDPRLKRMIYWWERGGEKTRRFDEGQIVEKLSTNSLVLDSSKASLRLLKWH